MCSSEKYVDDQLKRVKNACGKAIGEKMKKKETGGEGQLPEELRTRLEQLKLDDIKVGLTFLFVHFFLSPSTDFFRPSPPMQSRS